MIPGILVTLPIRTRSPNGGNPGNRWAAIAHSREKKQHRELARMALGGALASRGLKGVDLAPVLVTFTRVSPSKLDDDNVAFALKATRDGIADALGINDGDTARLRFRYRQRKGDRGAHAVEVLVEHRDPKPANVADPFAAIPAPQHALPRFEVPSVEPRKACACSEIPAARPLPEDAAWWAENWKRVAWRAHQCAKCGRFWNVRELRAERRPSC